MRAVISKTLCFAAAILLSFSFIGDALGQQNNVQPPRSIVKEALRLQQQKGTQEMSETPWNQDLKL